MPRWMWRIKHWPDVTQDTWVTYVPSVNGGDLVKNYAQSLARQLNLSFYDSIGILGNIQHEQKRMQNAHFQVQNLDGRFHLLLDRNIKAFSPCLLVDDVVSSGWTMTVCAALLGQAGVQKVFPMALALNSPYMD